MNLEPLVTFVSLSLNMDSDLLHIAIQAAAEVSPVLRDFHAQPLEVFTKSDYSPVTLADQAAHDIIFHRLSQTGFPIISEEGKGIEGSISHPAFWLVDPLDGTKEFIKKRNEFTINIAFIENGVAIAGIIAIPMERCIWVGASGALHKLSEADIEHGIYSKPATQVVNQQRTIVTSLSHPHPKINEFIAQERVQHPNLEVVSAGSSLKLCLAAIGSNTIYPRFAPCMIWDVAAGDAILRAAGKKIVQLSNGESIDYTAHSWVVPPFIAG
jgi:3'(2'), 5'-bisphosphate nucleotidase